MILRRDIFQALADPTRRSILLLLASQTVTAGTIAENFGSARSTVSKHVQILQECGLIEARPQGREIYYQLRMERMAEVNAWLEQLQKTWEDRFDALDQYLEQLKTQRQDGTHGKPGTANATDI